MRCVLVSLCCLAAAALSSSVEESMKREQNDSIKIELLEWDLEEEACVEEQSAEWKALLRQDQGFADDKVEALCSAANQRRQVANESQAHLATNYNSYELNRRVSLLSYPGLSLLPAPEYKQLAEFATRTELLQRGSIVRLAYGSERLENLTVAEVEGVLARSRDAGNLREVWMAWQKAHEPSDLESWSHAIELLNQAAELNEYDTVEAFWESQTEWPDGYKQAKKLWSEIEPLYRSFHGFVRRGLETHYKDVPEKLPVYLLGSSLGYDWSYIADLLLPMPEMYKELENSLRRKEIKGRFTYQHAQEIATSFGLPNLGTFASLSVFNGSCPAVFLPNCTNEFARVFTCEEISWQRYLEAHEVVFRAAHYHLAANNTYIFRHDARGSGLSEAMAGLGSLLATFSVFRNELIRRDGSDPKGQITNLRLLIALRILPRLSAALVSDLCRLKATPHSASSSPASLCWPLRREMQGIFSGLTSSLDEAVLFDALGDVHFTTHAPYLSEFAGLLVQFELLERLYGTKDPFTSPLPTIDVELRSALTKGISEPWMTILTHDLRINSVSSGPLLRFFASLKPIFDDMSPVADLEKELNATEVAPVLSISTEEVATDIFQNSTAENDAMQSEPPTEEDLSSASNNSTLFIALGAVVLGLIIVAASLILVNRKRKQRRVQRRIYNPVLRHSAGRPASFSPVVAKRLSENEAPPPPLLKTFREDA